MRKRILTGFVVAVGICAASYLLSGPKSGSIEWHKRRYVDVRERLCGYALFDRFVDAIGLVRSGKAQYDALHKERMLHAQALLDAGFLVEHKVPTNKTNAWAVAARMSQSKEAIAGYADVAEVGLTGRTNYFVVVIAPSNDVAKWVELVRKADSPQKPK